MGSKELSALYQLKEDQGELSSADELKMKKLTRATEKELIQAADVICVTCAGAGDPRLANIRFRKVPSPSDPSLVGSESETSLQSCQPPPVRASVL